MNFHDKLNTYKKMANDNNTMCDLVVAAALFVMYIPVTGNFNCKNNLFKLFVTHKSFLKLYANLATCTMCKSHWLFGRAACCGILRRAPV